MNQVQGHDIVVIGASLGGFDALPLLIAQLPKDLPAAVFIVMHLAPDTGAYLADRLKMATSMNVHLATNNDPIRHGNVYVAPSNYHMILKRDHVVLDRGPRENRFRPAIDPLFRSAALAYTSRVIGVILTGLMDDGTAGLWAVKRCGGVTIVQDPREAAGQGMPLSALEHVKADQILPVADMGDEIKRLVHEPAPEAPALPEDLVAEERLFKTTELSGLNKTDIGISTPYSCPECNGPLYVKRMDDMRIYRCNIGHKFTARSLSENEKSKIEGTLWSALEGLEENAQLLATMAEDEQKTGNELSSADLRAEARETLHRADLLRQMLLKAETVPEPEPRPEPEPAAEGKNSR